MTTAHTPVPWAVSKCHQRRITSSGKLICTAVLRNQNKPSPKNNAFGKDEAEALANAAHIVKCVNIHDELVEAFKSIIERSQNGSLGTSKVIDMRNIAIEALKKAGAL